MKKICTIYGSHVAAISLLLLLPGCGPFGTADKTETVKEVIPAAGTESNSTKSLFSIKDAQGNDMALVTEKNLEDYINMASEANPQVRMILEIMPDAEYDMFFKSMKRNALLREWAKRNKIDENQEYQRDLKMIIDMGRSSLDAQHFQKNLKIDVTDTEAKKHYQEHKHEIPGIIVSPEGVKTRAVFFENEGKAKEFLVKIKEKPADFDKFAKEFKVEVDDFGGVLSERSMIDQKAKDTVLGLKKFPSFDLIKIDDKKYGVFYSTEKQKAEYMPFEQIKDGLKNMLKEQKMNKAFEEELDKLEKTFGAVEHKEYFEQKKKAAEEARKKAEEEMKKAQDQEKKSKETGPKETKELS